MKDANAYFERRHDAAEVKAARDEERRLSLVDCEKHRLLNSAIGFDELYQEKSFEPDVIARTKEFVRLYRTAPASIQAALVEDLLEVWERMAANLADETVENDDENL